MNYKAAAVVVGLCFLGCASKQKVETPAPKALAQKSPPAAKADKRKADKDGLGVSLSGQDFVAIYFEFDSARLMPESQKYLATVAKVLVKEPQLVLTVEGHADERGTSEYNLALGDRRARAVSAYLATLGVKEQQVQTISYGEERPAVQGAGEEAWARNRRAEFVRRRG